MLNNEIYKKILNKLNAEKVRGKWNEAMRDYAIEFLENLENHYKKIDINDLTTYKNLKMLCLNGAESFKEYSYGGCSLVYNIDILENLFPKSIVEKYKNADTIRGVELLQYQARCLQEACTLLFLKIKNIIKEV